MVIATIISTMNRYQKFLDMRIYFAMDPIDQNFIKDMAALYSHEIHGKLDSMKNIDLIDKKGVSITKT